MQKTGGPHESEGRQLLDVWAGRRQEVGLAARGMPTKKLRVMRERGNMKSLLYSRVVLALALVVALAIASGAWWKWD